MTIRRRRIYHSFNFTESSRRTDDDSSLSTNLRLHVWKYVGDIYLIAAHAYAPIKLVPPYQYLNTSAYDVVISLCDLEVGLHYLALYGGHECALYDILAHTDNSEDCDELNHHGTTSDMARATELSVDHFERSTVAAGGYADFYVYVDDDHSHDNLIIEMVRRRRRPYCVFARPIVTTRFVSSAG